MNASPWWYRQRGLVLMAIYVLAFWAAPAVLAMLGVTYAPTFVWLGERLGPQGTDALLALAVVAMFGCFAIRAWGSAYLSAGVVWNPDALTDALLVDGPFRYTRNPLYLGNLFMALGFGRFATPLGFATIAIGHAIFLPMLMRYEAEGLRARYGAVYGAYERAVPPLFPRLTPARVAGSVVGTPVFAQGMRAEIFSGAAAVGVLALALFGHRAFLPFLELLVLGWLVQRWVTQKTAAV